MKKVSVVLMLFVATIALSACCNCPTPPQSYLDETDQPTLPQQLEKQVDPAAIS